MNRAGMISFVTASSILALMACNVPQKRAEIDVKGVKETDTNKTDVRSGKDRVISDDHKSPAVVKNPGVLSRSGRVDAVTKSEENSRRPSPKVNRLAMQPPSQHRTKSIRGYGMARIATPRPQERDKYAEIIDNSVHSVTETPVSTFSIDVDTASYANVRRILNEGRLPPKHAVRIEEMINYFNYGYAGPKNAERPFAARYDVTRTPWNNDSLLLRIGLKGLELDRGERKSANLVFLLDVSGSMNSAAKLQLLVAAMKMLTRSLDERDKVSIVVYAGASGVALEPTSGGDKGTIRAALERLRAGGSTAGGAGIRLAYSMAEKSFIKGGINRVILATDGDFNVGISSVKKLKEVIAKKRESGVSLTTLGFGRGNINDALMEKLADVGNGNYAYIDTAREARKVLGEQITGTLQTIAKDVKIQVEFNSAKIAEYRLIGYVNRKLKREDFNNDKIDAGEIGAGHQVTALYEITPVGAKSLRLGKLRYGTQPKVKTTIKANEFAFVKLRYKAPDGDMSMLIETPLFSAALDNVPEATGDLAFSSAVAAFGQKLRGGAYLENFSYREIARLAGRGLRSSDARPISAYRTEFIELVKLAETLDQRHARAKN